MDKERRKELKAFQRRIRCKFKRQSLLNLALTHKSFAYQGLYGDADHNERLEFLGDSVISLITSQYLYKKYPSLREGDLTKMRSQLVCADSLELCARSIDIGKYLLLGRGQLRSAGRERASNLARSFEALIGAMYLDRGLKVSEKFFINQIKGRLVDVQSGKISRDFKSLLQEKALQKFGVIPKYRVISERGPEHRKEFTVSVKIKNRRFGTGTGMNKKRAQQQSAKEALEKLRGEHDGHTRISRKR